MVGTTTAPRETRFALVLNGGVSLAVWMGGVTHELNRLRLASAGAKSRPGDEREAAVHDAWVAILEQVSRKAVVDTIAGTSAGGLNGTVLASAVAGGRDLPDMRGTWSELAALQPGKLLRGHADTSSSLLDGEFFQARIEDLLADMAGRNRVTDPHDCALLVTATALDPQPVGVRLEGEARASVVDSRRVYRFERRTDDQGIVKDDFTDARDSVALASRASASFPVAFEPVWETNALRGFREAPLGKPRSSWLMDGGVLDNAPFGPLLERLKARPIGAPFDRVVLYVTPSPGVAAADGLGVHPGVGKVLGRVLAAAREPDQRLDFQELRSAFEQMGYTRSAPHGAIYRLLCSSEPFMDASNALLAADQWFQTYRLSRAEAVERWLMSLEGDVAFAEPEETELPPRSLLSVPRQLVYTTHEWRWGLATAERALRWWGRALVDYGACAATADTAPAFEQLETSQRLVSRLWDELDTHMKARPGATPKARARQLNEFYRSGVDEQLGGAVLATAEAITSLPMTDGMDAATLINFTLAVEVVSAVLAWGEDSEGDAPRFRYRQVTPAAESIVDLGRLTSSPDWPGRKLYGERWGHFGAFASRSGRAADWLWGRLDGASALCDYLLEPLEASAERKGLRLRLAEAILAAEGTDQDGLREMATRAVQSTPAALLLDMERTERQVAVELLWEKAVDLLAEAGEADPSRLGAGQAIRIFADPTWRGKDLSSRRLRTRVVARLIRWYGAPARWMGRRRVRKFLDL